MLARFCKLKLFQDYFDEILRFQIGINETAAEAGLRLWNTIETIPKTRIPEDVITGFVISVLCQKDGLIRRELNAYTVTTKPQLLRILRGSPLKQRSEITEIQESDFKRTRDFLVNVIFVESPDTGKLIVKKNVSEEIFLG